MQSLFNKILIICSIALLCNTPMPYQLIAQQGKYSLPSKENNVLPGAYQLKEYLPLLKNKRVAIVGNQTSEINGVLLPDTLISLGVNIVKLFSPEHGFRGDADAGAKVTNAKDPVTGLPIISLYGKSKKIPSEALQNVDVVIYDLQDVGARFYTYISTLEYTMDACGENNKTLIVLDRPNPLAHVVDGPVLNKKYKSFVGMQAIPVIYGMTAGEYALMLKGEKWNQAPQVKMSVIQNKNYDRNVIYHLPVAPSPNLKNMAAIILYPSMCLFEGTPLSLGRGTNMPFQMFGHPTLKLNSYSFTPISMKGATSPPLMNQKCKGALVASTLEEAIKATNNGAFQLQWIIQAYNNFPDKKSFFTNFFNTLAGNNELQIQISKGMTEAEIKASWQKELDNFKKIRSKYLLYK